jgi:aspartate aminotransferase
LRWPPKPVVANLSKLQSQSTSNATSFVQKAAIAALAGLTGLRVRVRAEFIDLRDYMLAKLREIPGRDLHQAGGRVLRLSQHWAFLGKGGIGRQRNWRRGCCMKGMW